MLFVVHHRADLSIEHRVASHVEPTRHTWDQRWATLVDVDTATARKLANLDAVISVEVAPLGRFHDETDGAVYICADGSWVHEEDVGAED